MSSISRIIEFKSTVRDLSQFTYISSHNNLTRLPVMTSFPLFFFSRISLHPSSPLWISSFPHFSNSRITKIHEQIKLFQRYIWNRTSILSAHNPWHSLEFPIVSSYAREISFTIPKSSLETRPHSTTLFSTFPLKRMHVLHELILWKSCTAALILQIPSIKWFTIHSLSRLSIVFRNSLMHYLSRWQYHQRTSNCSSLSSSLSSTSSFSLESEGRRSFLPIQLWYSMLHYSQQRWEETREREGEGRYLQELENGQDKQSAHWE